MPYVSALFGFVVGLAGMRVLSEMVVLDPAKLDGLQRFASFGLDVVLTAVPAVSTGSCRFPVDIPTRRIRQNP
jgi:hypothetical protein